ncbi:MAG: hypothetical protein US30_C0004G0031 [Candidatus Moranbacteria bacterium GW2011_GWF2_36_839]|nr:MAG: hypothetical protein US27_C0002G0034 [Candidatus Moranbacteria bacterium GW2011_GWF1_36_78]KKQ17287.1 MAG: hypothetical protein US30_C0004G0031 [Candidatus Moranbacteria bacterium GW2011_GWF2_36_839]HAT73869.1 hypothetical protein [Candidatus Moranbacteria bacterium]HBY10988.1 hypothetical protein [Candidatus Moranbacteria bacterium]
MNFFKNPMEEMSSEKKINEASKKKKTSLIAGAMAAGAIFASADKALAEGKYVPDERVANRKEYVIPGVVDSEKVSGAIEAGVVEGAIKNDGKIYQEEKTIRDSENEKKTDMSNMRRGGGIVIDDKSYEIEK